MEQKKEIKLTRKQKAFCDKLLSLPVTEPQYKAAEGIYNIGAKHGTNDQERVAQSLVTENLRKPSIQEYLKEKGWGAANRMNDLSISAESENVRFMANKDILDRAFGKAESSMKIQGNVNVLNMNVFLENLEKKKDNTGDFVNAEVVT